MGVLVVGAGLSGLTVARELADAGVSVDVIDSRSHLGGNTHDYRNDAGIRVHQYGPHLFHTSNQKVVDWLSRFTEWSPYEHRVKALLGDGRYVTLPVNAETTEIVGSDSLVDTLFRPYTRKMWGLELEQLDPSVLARIPVRSDMNEMYFPDDEFQALPTHGYTALAQSIADHPRISVRLESAYVHGMERDYAHTFNSMPIDEFFAFDLGELPYRSIRFHTFTAPVPRLLPVATVNFTHDEPFTRVTEWSHLPDHQGKPGFTTLTVEEPCDYRDNHRERYYPVKDVEGRNRSRYMEYARRVLPRMTFIGRCGLYAYLDMDQAVNTSLRTARSWLRDLGAMGPVA